MVDIDYVLQAINENLDPLRVILFGSHAYGVERPESDLDVAIIQKDKPRLGDKAQVFTTLEKIGYDWSKEPDLHLFSEKEFAKKLESKDLFATEISKGRTIYAKN